MGGAAAFGMGSSGMTRRPRSDEGPEAIRVHSAGGVVARGSGDELEVVVMRSAYGTWVFPKGRVEAGEKPEAAACREVAEEVGLSGLTLVAPLGWTEHEFERENRRYRKRVDWFAFRAPEGAELRPSAEERALDAGWFGVEQALRMLTHADQRKLLRRAVRWFRDAGARER